MKERKGNLEVQLLTRGERARAIPLTTVSVNEAIMLDWVLAHREAALLCGPCHLWAGTLDGNRKRPFGSRKTSKRVERGKTIIHAEEAQPGSGTIVSPLALNKSPALLHVCSTATSE
jgi:hypothetical protein